jgi:hypothetical protein
MCCLELMCAGVGDVSMVLRGSDLVVSTRWSSSLGPITRGLRDGDDESNERFQSFYFWSTPKRVPVIWIACFTRICCYPAAQDCHKGNAF